MIMNEMTVKVKVNFIITSPYFFGLLTNKRYEYITLYPRVKEANDWKLLTEKLSMYKEPNETIEITKIGISN